MVDKRHNCTKTSCALSEELRELSTWMVDGTVSLEGSKAFWSRSTLLPPPWALPDPFGAPWGPCVSASQPPGGRDPLGVGWLVSGDVRGKKGAEGGAYGEGPISPWPIGPVPVSGFDLKLASHSVLKKRARHLWQLAQCGNWLKGLLLLDEYSAGVTSSPATERDKTSVRPSVSKSKDAGALAVANFSEASFPLPPSLGHTPHSFAVADPSVLHVLHFLALVFGCLGAWARGCKFLREPGFLKIYFVWDWFRFSPRRKFPLKVLLGIQFLLDLCPSKSMLESPWGPLGT